MNTAKSLVDEVKDASSSMHLVAVPSSAHQLCQDLNREYAASPPNSLPLSTVRRRRSYRPTVVAFVDCDDSNDTGERSPGGTRHPSGTISRRHSVSFMPSATRRRRNHVDDDDDDDDESLTNNARSGRQQLQPRRKPAPEESSDDESSSPERCRLQRTPTPYYEEPPTAIADVIGSGRATDTPTSNDGSSDVDEDLGRGRPSDVIKNDDVLVGVGNTSPEVFDNDDESTNDVMAESQMTS